MTVETVYAITPVQDWKQADGRYVWNPTGMADGDGQPKMMNPQSIESQNVWQPPVMTCLITSCVAGVAVPLHWPVDIRFLHKIEAKILASALAAANHTLSIRIGEDLTSSDMDNPNIGLIDIGPGKAAVDTAIIEEGASPINALWRGSPAVVLSNVTLATLISQLSPGTRLGRYFQIMMTPAANITSPVTICTKLRGWYR